MCDAISLGVASMAMSLASGASQASQTSKLNRIRQAEAERNQKYLIDQENYSSLARTIEQSQVMQRYSNAALDVSREAANALGRKQIEIAEGGLRGKSVTQMLDDFRRQEGEQLAGIDYNLAMARSGSRMEAQASGINSKLSAASAQPIGGPTALSVFAGAIQSGVSMGLSATAAGVK